MAVRVLLMVRSLLKLHPVFPLHRALTGFTVIVVVLAVAAATSSTNNLCDGVKCVHGTCRNVTETRWICICDQGWGSGSCDTCLGRVKYVGFLVILRK